MNDQTADCAPADCASAQRRVELLRTLVDEGIHAAADFNLPRLEQLIEQQEVAARGLGNLSDLQAGRQAREDLRSSYRQLRRSAIIFSQVLQSTSQTLSAYSVARQAAAWREVN